MMAFVFLSSAMLLMQFVIFVLFSFHKKCGLFFLLSIYRMTMSFLTDRISLADEETFGIGVIIKKEFNDDVTEETCLDSKEEPLYHGNEASGGVTDVKVNHKCFNSNNLHELRHERNPKGSCDMVMIVMTC